MFETIAIVVAVFVGGRYLKKSIPKIKGNILERKTARKAKKMRLPGKVRVMRDSLFRAERGYTNQSDVLVVTRYGIFDLECKNHRADVYGTMDSNYWYCKYPRLKDQHIDSPNFAKPKPEYKRSASLYNPFRQSKGHTDTISYNLAGKYPDVPCYSLVVFSDKAALHIQNSRDKVCQLRQLEKVIQRVGEKEVLTDRQVDDIANILESRRVKGFKAKRSHVRTINDNRGIRKMMKHANIEEIEQHFIRDAETKPIWSANGNVQPEEMGKPPAPSGRPLSEILQIAKTQAAENQSQNNTRNTNQLSR